ncbi:MAG: hypothetical protein P8X90_11190 [Desulfobacterales bacterium]
MEINPFEDVIVSEPRRIEKPVSGLNDKPLQTLVGQFAALAGEPLPRASKPPGARLIISPEPGYGKSHLIGRLFRELRGSATLVYLRPFTDPGSCWKSILLKMVQEMEFPDSAAAEFCVADEPNQLEALMHGIIMNVLVIGIESGTVRLKNKKAALDFLKKASLNNLRQNKKWVDLVGATRAELARQMQAQLDRTGSRLNASPTSWLGVLATYAYFPNEFDQRQACLDWLKGGSLDAAEAEKIGIRPADRLSAELSVEQTNEQCKQRIQDFCDLAGYYRPFVFCFDQTENYGTDPEAARKFGEVIQDLVNECSNVFIVVTANQQVWTNRVLPNWEEAQRHRLAQPFLELEPINRDQALELIRHRLSQWQAGAGESDSLTDHSWLDEMFRDTKAWGVRQLLHRCARRWQEIKDQKIVPPAIEEYYRAYIRKLKSQPRRMVYDPDILTWLVREVIPDPDIAVKPFRSHKGYFTVHWKHKGQNVYFGFESGSHWSRWKAISREAQRYFESDKQSKAVLFRTPELKAIPGQWKIAPQINKAKQQYLHVFDLSRTDMAELYAAYDLYAAAREGDVPFSPADVIEFIRVQLKSFWTRIREADPTRWKPAAGVDAPEPAEPAEPAEPRPGLISKIRNIVRREKFLSVEELMAKIKPPISEDELHKARACIAEIRVHTSPTMTVLQWQSTT